MPLFTFSLDNFQITQTRSAHTDTDYVIFTVKLGQMGRAESFPVKQLGNLNNGTYEIGFNSENNTVLPDSPVVLNYLIVNSSLDLNTVITHMSNISNDLANGPLLGLPPFTSALSYVNREYASELSKLTKLGSCDGLVAAEQNNLTYEELVNYTSRSPYFTQVTNHIGTQVPSGCNSRASDYFVHWSMKEVGNVSYVNVPTVVQLPLGVSRNPSPGTAYYDLEKVGFQVQVTGSGTLVTGQNPPGLTPAPVGSLVTLLTGPQL